MAKYFSEMGYDICAFNFRGCSGRMNNSPRIYHSGDFQDLMFLVDYIADQYGEINLAGFSMGGNVILKYLGNNEKGPHSKIKRAAVFSVPLNLAECSQKLSRGFSKIYTEYFFRSLRQKLSHLNSNYPDLNLPSADKLKNFYEFDTEVTAKLFGFRDAEDYYQKASSIGDIENIQVETLIVNAKNDPFLGESCFLDSQTLNNPKVYFQATRWGGHVGFYEGIRSQRPWFVDRAYEFFAK